MNIARPAGRRLAPQLAGVSLGRVQPFPPFQRLGIRARIPGAGEASPSSPISPGGVRAHASGRLHSSSRAALLTLVTLLANKENPSSGSTHSGARVQAASEAMERAGPKVLRECVSVLEERDRPDPSRSHTAQRVRTSQALQMEDQDDPPPPAVLFSTHPGLTPRHRPLPISRKRCRCTWLSSCQAFHLGSLEGSISAHGCSMEPSQASLRIS